MRPNPGHAQSRKPLTRFAIKAVREKRCYDLQERLCPPPMFRMVRNIQARNHLWWHTFALHFVHQCGKAVGQIVKRRARRKIRLYIQQPADQLRQFQPAAQRRGCGRQPQSRIICQIRNQQYLRQKRCPFCRKQIGNPPPHSGSVHI